MKQNPIGVFDSGLGGLTAVKELRQILPGENIVYFGDTGRVPYGSRGRDTIIAYAKQDIAFLLSKGVKTLLAACGTISSTLPKRDSDLLPVPYTGVVGAAALAAAKATKTGQVGVIGTEATIASHSYEDALRGLSPAICCTSNACPLFVPLVENGHFKEGDPLAKLAAELYLAPLRAAEVDTVILGCTHYPLLASTLAAEMGAHVTLIDPGREAALALRDTLRAQDLLNPNTGGGSVEYYVTDDPARFGQLARVFLGGEAGGRVERINIEEIPPCR